MFSQVTKNFAGHEVLHSLSFSLKVGRGLAILGPNGAGKTTMIRILMGVLMPSSGSLSVFGQPISTSAFESKKKIGVVIEEQNFFLDMSAWDYLSLFGELYEVRNSASRALSLLKYMELYDARHKKLKEYSTGMKKKLNIIQAVLHSPEILILDEPFSGLDPLGISLTVDLLSNLRASETTLVISSHILSEIDGIVEDLMLIDNGVVKAYGPKEELWRSFGGNCLMNLTLQEANPEGIKALKNLPEIISTEDSSGLEYLFLITGDEFCRKRISKTILDNNLQVSHLSFSEPSVKMIYEKIMGTGFQSKEVI